MVVNTPTIAVTGTGGTFEVPILTSGLAQDETVEITADADWVSNLQATNDKFSFEVSKSPLDVDSRTAIFSLSLSKHPSIKATCTLTQGKNHENFYIQMDELRGNSAIYTVTPALSLSEGHFISYCFSSDEFAKYKSPTEVKDAIWAKQLATAEEIAEKYDKYISTSLSYRSRKGSDISVFNPNSGAETKSILAPQWIIKNDIKQSEAPTAGTATRGSKCILIK